LTLFDRGWRVRRNADGKYTVRIPRIERRVLAGIPEALGRTLETARDGVGGAPELLRLFPPAYTDDEEAERTYRELMHRDLLEQHQQALSVLEATANLRELDEEQLSAWLGALNDARLVLGTTLGVSEDSEPLLRNDDDRGRYSLYIYLSALVAEIVDELESGLPTPATDPDYSPPEDPWGDPPEGLRWSTPGAPNVQGAGRVPGPPSWLVESPIEPTPDPPGETG
jgi:hypothetical protein